MTCLALRLDIRTLVIAFNSDVVVTGDVQLLGRQSVVALPDLQTDAVDTSVRAKVNAVVGCGQAVRRDTDFGTAGCVDELLEGEVCRGSIEAVVAMRGRIANQLLR